MAEGWELITVVLFPLYTVPCGPIHIVFTITGVSTTDGRVNIHRMLVLVPRYNMRPEELTIEVIFGGGTVGELFNTNN
jgi:hypothetical protein